MRHLVTRQRRTNSKTYEAPSRHRPQEPALDHHVWLHVNDRLPGTAGARHRVTFLSRRQPTSGRGLDVGTKAAVRRPNQGRGQGRPPLVIVTVGLMPPLPRVTGRKLVRALESLGWVVVVSGARTHGSSTRTMREG